MDEFDLIIGIHSIAEALRNSERRVHFVCGTEDSLELLAKTTQLPNEVKTYSSHKVQEEAKKYFKQMGLEYQRVPSNLFLIAAKLDVMSLPDFYEAVLAKPRVRILCLDQITDIHNAGAILRTASFYQVDYVVVPGKQSFGLTPSFFRIASGAAEFVKLVESNKLSRTVSKLKELNIPVVGLSEHAKGDLASILNKTSDQRLALVLGREDVGISHAVIRQCDYQLSLTPQGETKSLNVSIASAIAMEKCFGLV